MTLEMAFAIGAGILIVGAVLLVGFGLYILFFTNELDTVLEENDDK